MNALIIEYFDLLDEYAALYGKLSTTSSHAFVQLARCTYLGLNTEDGLIKCDNKHDLEAELVVENDETKELERGIFDLLLGTKRGDRAGEQDKNISFIKEPALAKTPGKSLEDNEKEGSGGEQARKSSSLWEKNSKATLQEGLADLNHVTVTGLPTPIPSRSSSPCIEVPLKKVVSIQRSSKQQTGKLVPGSRSATKAINLFQMFPSTQLRSTKSSFREVVSICQEIARVLGRISQAEEEIRCLRAEGQSSEVWDS